MRRVPWLAPVAWMALILWLGSDTGSAERTGRLILPALRFVFPTASPLQLDAMHAGIRKLAHLTEYALLAFWVVRALARSSYLSLRNSRYLLAVVLVLVIASLDEFNQSFEPSRTSTVWDVGLDLVGGAAMAVILKLFDLRRNARQKRAQSVAS